MRQYRMILFVALVWAAGATGTFAGERADWGRVVYIGTASEGPILLIENDTGIQALVMDPYGELRTVAGEQTTLAMIKPDDHVDFAVSTWAGMQIVDLVHVTPRPQRKLASSR